MNSQASQASGQKYRPVFSEADLVSLMALLNSIPLETQRIPQNRKILHYLDTFLYKIQSGKATPQYALKVPEYIPSMDGSSSSVIPELSMDEKYAKGLLSPDEEKAYENQLMGISK